MTELLTVAFALLLMAAAGIAAVRASLPPALGYLAAGVITATWFGDSLPVHALEGFAEIGVLALLFFIGLELDLKRLRQALRSTAWSIPFDLAVPGLAIAAAARVAGWDFNAAIALGMALSVSSTLFGERFTSLPGTSRGTRERVIGVLISEDVAAAGLIGIMIVLAGGGDGWVAPIASIGKLLFFLVLLTAAAVFVIPRILDEVARRHVPEVLALWAAGLVLLAAWAGILAGSPELGALVAGVAAAESGSRYVVRNTLSGVRDLAAATFFLSTGLAIHASTFLSVWPMAIAIAALFMLGKLWVHVPAAIAGGLRLRESLHSAFALATVGEFSLILAAVAANEGIGHPDMRAVIVTAMILLLPIAAVVTPRTERLETGFWRLPPRIRRPFAWLAQGLRGGKQRAHRQPQWQASARLLAANLLLIAGWYALTAWLRPRLEPHLPELPLPTGAAWFGVVTGLAIPLLVGGFRSYRQLVWELVGLREGESKGAGKVRARLVDAAVMAGFVLVLVLASLRYPQTAPVVAVGAGMAAIVAALAWRQLSSFHRAMEESVGRVLGHDPKHMPLLDQVIGRYPWGVQFVAVVVPPGSPVAHRSLVDSRIAPLSGAMVAVLQRGRKETVSPPGDTVVRPGDTLVLLGDVHQVARAEALVVSHGESIRLTAQSHAATVQELEIQPASPWNGATIEQTDIRHATGTLVVGVWQEGHNHPKPYRADLRLQAGDRLILLGTPLQIQRAKLQTEGIPEAQP